MNFSRDSLLTASKRIKGLWNPTVDIRWKYDADQPMLYQKVSAFSLLLNNLAVRSLTSDPPHARQ